MNQVWWTCVIAGHGETLFIVACRPRLVAAAGSLWQQQTLPDKAQVHTKAAMLPRTGQTDEYSVWDRGPGWVLVWAVKADLPKRSVVSHLPSHQQLLPW